MTCQRITAQELLVQVTYLALKLYGMSENYSTRFASPGLILCFESVWHGKELQQRNCYLGSHTLFWSSMACQRITSQELLVQVSYLALKQYGMSENYSTRFASPSLILCFESVWHGRESQQRNCYPGSDTLLWSSMACQRITAQELLVQVSYLALKKYGMSENYSTRFASPGLIPHFEEVWHAWELQHRNC